MPDPSAAQDRGRDKVKEARGRRLDPAEKAARAADRLLDGIGGDPVVARSREIHERVKNGGGQHFISHARLIALADALNEWRTSKEAS